MDPGPSFRYGVATPAEFAGKTGREILQAIIDGELPQPPIAEAMSFWITEVGDGVAVFEGEPGAHLLNPMGAVHGGWALTLIDSAGGCAGHVAAAGRVRLRHDRDQGQSRPADHQGHRPGPRRGARGRAGPPDHLDRGEGAERGRARCWRMAPRR